MKPSGEAARGKGGGDGECGVLPHKAFVFMNFS